MLGCWVKPQLPAGFAQPACPPHTLPPLWERNSPQTLDVSEHVTWQGPRQRPQVRGTKPPRGCTVCRQGEREHSGMALRKGPNPVWG